MWVKWNGTLHSGFARFYRLAPSGRTLSEDIYINLSASKKLFKRTRRRCWLFISDGDLVAAQVFTILLEGLNTFVSQRSKAIINQAPILDTSFSNDFLCNDDSLRNISLLSNEVGINNVCIMSKKNSIGSCSADQPGDLDENMSGCVEEGMMGTSPSLLCHDTGETI